MGSEDKLGLNAGLSTTVEDTDIDIINLDDDSSPGLDDKLEEEANKASSVTPTSSPFGSPSNIFSTPNVQTPSTSSFFGSPTTPQQSSWNSGILGISSQPSTSGFNNYTTPSQSIWGSNNNNGWGSNNNSNPGWSWGSNNSQPFNAFNNSPGTWGWNNNTGNQKPGGGIQVIDKKIVFCSFIDTIVCSFNSFSNGRLTYINKVPSDLSDMYIRKEVLFKMSRITADTVFIIVPSELIRSLVCNTSLNQKRPEDIERDMNGVIEYLRMCVMTFMKHTISDSKYCQFLMTPNTDWRFLANLISSEVSNIKQYTNNHYDNKSMMFLGANGGANGYGMNDKMIAEHCGIDYLDTNILLNY